MAQTCQVCGNKNRAEIDKALGSGVPLRTIADQYGPSKTALIRHRDGCIREAVKALIDEMAAQTPAQQLMALKAKNSALVSATDFLTQLSDNLKAAKEVLDEARNGYPGDDGANVPKNPFIALRAIDTINKTLGMSLELVKEIREQESHDVARMRKEQDYVLQVIMEELLDHPEISERISERLKVT
jgi:hypothetical protein